MCYSCGARKALHSCGCGARVCDRHAYYPVDDANYAVTDSARPKCGLCWPQKFPRPYTLARAIEREEWWVN